MGMLMKLFCLFSNDVTIEDCMRTLAVSLPSEQARQALTAIRQFAAVIGVMPHSYSERYAAWIRLCSILLLVDKRHITNVVSLHAYVQSWKLCFGHTLFNSSACSWRWAQTPVCYFWWSCSFVQPTDHFLYVWKWSCAQRDTCMSSSQEVCWRLVSSFCLFIQRFSLQYSYYYMFLLILAYCFSHWCAYLGRRTPRSSSLLSSPLQVSPLQVKGLKSTRYT